MEDFSPTTSFLITVVAHAETDEHLSQVVITDIDPSLNNNGVNQATQVGQHLKDIFFNKAHCSDLKRAQESAKIILDCSENQNQPKLNADKRIRGRNTDGMQKGALLADLAEEALLWSKKENRPMVEYDYIGAESYENLKSRVVNFFEELSIRECYAGGTSQNILVVSHSDWILTLVDYLLNNQHYSLDTSGSVSDATTLPFLPSITSAAITQIRINRKIERHCVQKFRICTCNDTVHLR